MAGNRYDVSRPEAPPLTRVFTQDGKQVNVIGYETVRDPDGPFVRLVIEGVPETFDPDWESKVAARWRAAVAERHGFAPDAPSISMNVDQISSALATILGVKIELSEPEIPPVARWEQSVVERWRQRIRARYGSKAADIELTGAQAVAILSEIFGGIFLQKDVAPAASGSDEPAGLPVDYVMAMGMLTTMHPTMEIDVEDPIDMARQVIHYIASKILRGTADAERLREQVRQLGAEPEA